MSVIARPPTRLQAVARTSDTLGESPFWDWRTSQLYWIDLRRPSLNCLDPSSGEVNSWPMPELIGSVVGRRSGGLVVALQSGLYGFSPATGTHTALLGLESDIAEHRLNDAKCDAHGRLWIGSMWDFGRNPTGKLYRIEPDRSVHVVRERVSVPNAIAFSPDQSTIYFTDSKRSAIERAAVDDAGRVSAWGELVADNLLPGAPDGATVDAEGFLWNARFRGGCLARISPTGAIDRVIDLPVSQPTSCAFGGPDLDTLFVTTGRQGMTMDALAAEPEAGSLLALDVGVKGLREPLFLG